MIAEKTPARPNFKMPISLSSKEFAENKVAIMNWLREHEPVHKGKMFSVVSAYFLTRYEDCVAMLKDERFVRNRTTATGGSRMPFPMPKSVQALMNSMINEDEPEHRRLRTLVHKAFTPRQLVKLEGRIQEITHELLDKAEKNGRMELMEAFARPIPVTVIAEMVGVKVKEVPELTTYVDALTDGMSGFALLQTLFLRMPKAVKFMKKLIERKRTNPADDILTALIEAEEDGERLSEDELVAMIFLLIIAGHETTYNLITNATLTLLQHPDQLQMVRERPSLWEPAIEEVLRFNGPIITTKPEYAIEPVTYHGVTIPKGTAVMPLLAAANRDPSMFNNPDQFDILREKKRHLGFGMGIHYCLGAPLARLETKIGLQTLFERNPNLRLAVDPSELSLSSRPGWHQYKALPVLLG